MGVQSQLLLTSLNEDSSSWGSLLSHTINVITSLTNVTCLSSGITKGHVVPYLSTKWQAPFLTVVCKSAAHSSRSGKTRATLNAQGRETRCRVEHVPSPEQTWQRSSRHAAGHQQSRMSLGARDECCTVSPWPILKTSRSITMDKDSWLL